MKANDYWQNFVATHNVENVNFSAYAFGSNDKYADELANLVEQGKKTATSSVYDMYLLEEEDLPKVGDYNVILDSQSNAVCVTKTTAVKVVRFKDVSESHAYLEGEGDRSLEYWIAVHAPFFAEEYAKYLEPDKQFTMDSLCVCEEFEVLK